MKYVPCNLDEINDKKILAELADLFYRLEMLVFSKSMCKIYEKNKKDLSNAANVVYSTMNLKIPDWAQPQTKNPKPYYTPCNLDEIDDADQLDELKQVYNLMHKLVCYKQLLLIEDKADKNTFELFYDYLPEWAKWRQKT